MAGEQAATATVAVPEVTTEPKTRRLPPYNVVILNDEEHTFPYVIELLIKLFRHDHPKAEELTWRIHTTGRADRLHDAQRTRRDEARPGHRLRRRPAARAFQGADALLRRAGAPGVIEPNEHAADRQLTREWLDRDCTERGPGRS